MNKLLYTAKHMMTNYAPGQLIHVYKLNRPLEGLMVRSITITSLRTMLNQAACMQVRSI